MSENKKWRRLQSKTFITEQNIYKKNMAAFIKKEDSIFFNHSFDKKRLKALISWVFKKFGEAEALRVLDLLKETGFRHATKAGISIGVHDLTTPIQKSWLISESQLAMNITDRDFIGAKITATERSQRIIDTWHRASESLSKQVVDYFGIYDQFNPVYIMALSGARGNFSQVRQLIGMRGLMADQQGKIVNFPILSNLREGLTLTEYFISCSGARKGLVDTALRTADTGYLTRRLVDVSHNVVVKRIKCNTNRGIAFKSLQSYNKVLLALKERLVGRVLAEDIEMTLSTSSSTKNLKANSFRRSEALASLSHTPESEHTDFANFTSKGGRGWQKFSVAKPKKSLLGVKVRKTAKLEASLIKKKEGAFITNTGLDENESKGVIAKKDQEISPKLSLEIARVRDKVFIRSPLTCGFTNEVCQLCYGWSISQGSLVSLGDAVGVIAAQSIGEPGTQLTMRTFHTGGVFSGDLLQEIRAPHPGTIQFSKAFQGLLIRTAHGRIAFLSKTKGSLILSKDNYFTEINIQAFTMLFVKQGEEVKSNQLLAEYSIQSKEGNQPIKTQQTIFAELSGRVIEDRSGTIYTKPIKESLLLLDPLQDSFSTPFLEETKLLSTAVTSQKGRKKSKEGKLLACRAQKGQRVASLCPYPLKGVTFGEARQGAQRETMIVVQKGVTKSSFASTEQERKSTPAFAARSFSLRSKAKAYFAQQKTNRVAPCFASRVVPQIVLRSKTKISFASIKEGKGGGKRGLEEYGGVQLPRIACKASKGTPFGGSKARKVGVRQNKASMEESAKTSKSLICNEYPTNRFLKSKAHPNPLEGVREKSRNTSLKIFPLTFFLRRRAFPLMSQLRVAKPLRGKKVDFRKLRKLKKENVFLLSKKRKKESDVHTGFCVTNEIGKNTQMGSRAGVGKPIYKPQIVSSLKNEDLENDVFKYVEPVKSGRLGFLKILSTRVGATLDYMCPIKPFDYYLIKKKRRRLSPFQRGNGFLFFRFSNPVLASPVRFSEARLYTPVVEQRKSYGKEHSEELIKPRVAGFRYACRARTLLGGFGQKVTQVRSSAFSKENYLKDNIPRQNKEIRLKKAVKYLHPEYIKENRFFLQTIAEYGDIVEEEYKTKII